MKKLTLFLPVFVLLALVSASDAQDADPGFKIVINAANPTTEIEAKDVSKMFKKTLVRWEDWTVGNEKERVLPIDQTLDSAAREAFSEAVHGKSPSAIVSYWNRMIFSGTEAPPDQVGSDRQVLEFVRDHSGAIGYVSGHAELGEGVKELKLASDG